MMQTDLMDLECRPQADMGSVSCLNDHSLNTWSFATLSFESMPSSVKWRMEVASTHRIIVRDK